MSSFTEIKSLKLRGFWADDIRIDRLLVEANICPNCDKPLEYKAYSNVVETHTFGVCAACEYARQFWLDGVRFAAAKKQISGAT